MVSANALTDRRLKVLGIALASLNIILWYCVPAIRAYLTGRPSGPGKPYFINGVQELFVYFDPWLARGVLPVVYTLGFVAIAFLYKANSDAVSPRFASVGSFAVAMLLLGFEAVWIFLIAVAMFFRGPDWNFYWPWETWNPKVVPLNNVNLSDVFWVRLTGRGVEDMPWFVREAPGLILSVAYLALGLLIARNLSRGKDNSMAYWCFVLMVVLVVAIFSPPWLLVPWIGLIVVASYLLHRLISAWLRTGMTGGSMSFWRCLLLVFLVELAALVPLKMVMRWTFNLKYLIFVPEHFYNL
jgi:hypothetical protein